MELYYPFLCQLEIATEPYRLCLKAPAEGSLRDREDVEFTKRPEHQKLILRSYCWCSGRFVDSAFAISDGPFRFSPAEPPPSLRESSEGLRRCLCPHPVLQKQRIEMPNYQLTAEEAAGVAAIRAAVKPIPLDLDTDLNLRRWHIGWRGKIDQIQPRLSAYIRNRKAAGYDAPDFVANITSLPTVARNLRYYSISRFLDPVIVRKSNTILFIQVPTCGRVFESMQSWQTLKYSLSLTILAPHTKIVTSVIIYAQGLGKMPDRPIFKAARKGKINCPA